MSRSITVSAIAKKGAAHRALRQAVHSKRQAIETSGEELPELLRVLGAAHVAANKLIPAAGTGEVLGIQIEIRETPLGGWTASVLVDQEAPAFDRRR